MIKELSKQVVYDPTKYDDSLTIVIKQIVFTTFLNPPNTSTYLLSNLKYVSTQNFEFFNMPYPGWLYKLIAPYKCHLTICEGTQDIGHQ